MWPLCPSVQPARLLLHPHRAHVPHFMHLYAYAFVYVCTRTGAQARAHTRQRQPAQQARAVLEARLGRAEHATAEAAAWAVWGHWQGRQGLRMTLTSSSRTRWARRKALRRSLPQLCRSPRVWLQRAPVNVEEVVQVVVQVVVRVVRVEAARPSKARPSKSLAQTARGEPMATVDCSRLFLLRRAPAQEPRQRRTEGWILPVKLRAGWSRGGQRRAMRRMRTRPTWRSWTRSMWARR